MKLRNDKLFDVSTFNEVDHYNVLHNDWLDLNSDYVEILRNSWLNYLKMRPVTIPDMVFITSTSHSDDSAALELVLKLYADIDWQSAETLTVDLQTYEFCCWRLLQHHVVISTLLLP